MSVPKDREAYNAARRKRYAEDPEFRAQLLAYTKKHVTKNREHYNEYARQWKKKTRKNNPDKARSTDRRLKYKVPDGWYEEQLAKQGGGCAICGRNETGMDSWNKKLKRLSIDHNHKCCPGGNSCGKCVRGILCSKCNPALAMVEEVPDWCAKALAYLSQYS
jgi:hypothetical protein